MSRRTQDTATSFPPFRLRGFHPLWQAFPKPFYYSVNEDVAVLQPRLTTKVVKCLMSNVLFPLPITHLSFDRVSGQTVWAPSVSLAATPEIIVIFSSRGT